MTSGIHLFLILMASKLDIGIYKRSCHDKDIKLFSEGFGYIFITLLSLKGKTINLRILRRRFSDNLDDFIHISGANVILFSD
jgi:hypothetical protein